MSFANSSISDIIATTIQHRSSTVYDNVTKHNALLAYLRKNGRAKTFSGGDVIRLPVSFAENGNFAWYTGYDLLPVAAQDVISSAEYAIKQCAVAVTVSGRELLQNSGPEQKINLLEERVAVAEATMANQMSSAAYGDGTASGGNSLVGLGAMIVDTPTTGTVGGIDAATWTFWRNQQTDPGPVTATTITGFMNTIYNSCTRGNDMPDLVLTTASLFGTYEATLQNLQRFTDTNTAELGFQTYRYKGANVVQDGGIGGNCPTGIMYFINTKYLYLFSHKERNMVPLSPTRRTAINQDAEVQILGWAGALACAGRQFQGHMDCT